MPLPQTPQFTPPRGPQLPPLPQKPSTLIGPQAPSPQALPLSGPQPAQTAAKAPQPKTPPSKQALQDMAIKMSMKMGLDPNLVGRVISRESSWNPAARSPKGAMGLMQLMPEIAAKYKVDASDPIQNVFGGLSYLKELQGQYKGDMTKALSHYNSGRPDAAHPETQEYLKSIFEGYKPFQQQSTGPVKGLGPQGTIGPRQPGIGERLSNLITPYDPVHGRQQLLQPEAMMTGPEQQAHPMLTGAAQFAGGMTTPGNLVAAFATGGLGTIPGVAGKILPRLVSAGFSAQMLKGIYDGYPEFKAAADKGDVAEMERIGTQLGLTGIAAAFGIRHAASGGVEHSSQGTLEDQITKAGLEDKGAEAIQAKRLARRQQQAGERAMALESNVKGPGPEPPAGLLDRKGLETSKPALEKPAPEISLPPERHAELEAQQNLGRGGKLSSDEAIDLDRAELARRSAQGEGIPKSPLPMPKDVSEIYTEKKPSQSKSPLAEKALSLKAQVIRGEITQDEATRQMMEEAGKPRQPISATPKEPPKPPVEAPRMPQEPSKLKEATPTPVAKPVSLKPKDRAAILKEAYKPGKIVKSYGGTYDKVLEFKEGDPSKAYPDNSWRVKVIGTDKEGNVRPGESERWHSTPPEKSDLKSSTQSYLESRFGKGKERGAIRVQTTGKSPVAQALGFLEGDKDKRMGQEITREETGKLARRKELIYHYLDNSRRNFDKETSPERGLALIDAIEGGEADRQARGVRLDPKVEAQLQNGKSKLTPDDLRIQKELGAMFKDGRLRIQNLGTGKLSHWIENYFPHLWERPGQGGIKDIARQMIGKKPLEGPKSFLKQRSIPTTLEGISKGLKPVHDNPINLALTKLHEINRYVMAHEILNEAKQKGIARLVKGQIPRGWTTVDDKMFTVRQWSAAEKGFVERGRYMMPEGAAKVINRYLSPGLRGKLPYDIIRHFSNSMNQVQLGFSGYHLGTTAVNAIVSQFARGVERIAPGKFWSPGRAARGLADIATSPLAGQKYMWTGANVAREYLSPKSSNSYARTAQAISMAGGRIHMDPVYRNSAIEGFFKSWKDHPWNKGPALLKAIPALIEAQSKPVMEWAVPTMKLGAFHDMASDIFEKASSKNWTREETRSAMQKAWDSVDNRFGQVVYDNLNWNKTAKDLSMIAVRSVGWNFGTGRELGGGFKDALTQSLKLASGEGFEMTHRMAYTTSLPVVIGLMGGIYQVLHTGQWPQTLKEYFYPKTGKKTKDGLEERVNFPSYMKDVNAYKNHPLTTSINKLNPGISSIYEMLNNRDFYGKPIRHIDDPFMKKIADSGKFAGQSFTPFSARNFQTRVEQTPESAAETFFGITPAPKEQERSEQQNANIQRYLEKKAEGGRQLRPRRPKQTF